MSYKSRFLRLALAVSVAGVISAQIPMSGGVAMAADDYDLNGSSSSRGLVEAAVAGLAAYGFYSTFSSGNTVPPADAGGAGPVDAGAPVPPASVDQPVWDVANNNPDLNQFAAESDKAGLKPTLRDTGTYTVFSPTNAAFSLLPPGTLTTLETPENAAQFKMLISEHIVAGHRYTIADLKVLPGVTADPGASLPTLGGSMLYLKYTAGTIPSDPGTLAASAVPFGPGAEDGVVVTQTDIPARNGVLHPVAGVLVPPAGAATPTVPAAPGTPATTTTPPATTPPTTPPTTPAAPTAN